MNWRILRYLYFLDSRAHFLKRVEKNSTLLDLGSSTGETLNHFYEMYPDLKYYAIDIEDFSKNYPEGTTFFRVNLENEKIKIASNSISAITCMHLVEHLHDLQNMLNECYRILKSGGKMYIETPHPKTLILSSPRAPFTSKFTINFFDDLTHTKPIVLGAIAKLAENIGFKVIKTGISRNFFFAVSYLFFFFLPPSKKKYTSYVHFKGWSSYIILEKPTA